MPPRDPGMIQVRSPDPTSPTSTISVPITFTNLDTSLNEAQSRPDAAGSTLDDTPSTSGAAHYKQALQNAQATPGVQDSYRSSSLAGDGSGQRSHETNMVDTAMNSVKESDKTCSSGEKQTAVRSDPKREPQSRRNALPKHLWKYFWHPHYISAFLIALSALLMLLVTLSTPYIRSISFLDAYQIVRNKEDNFAPPDSGPIGIKLGTWGYCVFGTDFKCSSPSLGYQLDDTFLDIDDIFRSSHLGNDLIHTLTYGLIVHPLSFGFLLLALTLDLLNHYLPFIGYIWSTMFTMVGLAVCILAVCFDFIVFVGSKNRINQDAANGASRLGNGVWMTLATMILLLVAAMLQSYCSWRRRRNSLHESNRQYFLDKQKELADAEEGRDSLGPLKSNAYNGQHLRNESRPTSVGGVSIPESGPFMYAYPPYPVAFQYPYIYSQPSPRDDAHSGISGAPSGFFHLNPHLFVPQDTNQATQTMPPHSNEMEIPSNIFGNFATFDGARVPVRPVAIPVPSSRPSSVHDDDSVSNSRYYMPSRQSRPDTSSYYNNEPFYHDMLGSHEILSNSHDEGPLEQVSTADPSPSASSS